MQDSLFSIAGHPVTFAEALLALMAIAVLLGLGALLRRGRGGYAGAETAERVGELVHAQNEMAGRLQAMAALLSDRQQDLAEGLGQRMDMLGHRVGQTLTESAKVAHTDLSHLAERLAVIDAAQRNLADLSKEMVGLQAILSDKQQRGAFGQARMEAIVADGLPRGRYAFQATLSNGTRPDCLIAFPNGAPRLAVDAKFPLEAWTALREAGDADTARRAETQFRRDMAGHVRDIAGRYLIAGETQDTAFMFVPSESMFSDLHERFADIVQLAYRARVVIVSPSLLLLAIQVIQSLLRDAEMRAQAHVIQDEVRKLVEDVMRLDERVGKLQGHFGQALRDIDEINTSSKKIRQRGERINGLDFSDRMSAEAERGNGPAGA